MTLFRLPEHLSKQDRRTSWVAFGFLLVLMLAHALLETVRDALFLGALPAERLPYVYLLIVAVSVAVSQKLSKFLSRVRVHVALQSWLLVSAVVTAAFWAFIGQVGTAGFYALYVWSALVTTIALIQFWTLLGDVLAMRSAKQVYAFVGAGSAVGAIVGSGIAAGVTQLVGARQGLLIAAVVLAASALGPYLLGRWNREKLGSAETENPAEQMREIARKTMSRVYPRRVAALVATAAITVTLGDYLFKSSVAAAVPDEQLGVVFGAAYFVFNVVGLFVQIALVNAVIRRFTLTSALGVLPALILIGGTGFIVGGGVIAAVVLRGADGALRHSLHRTALELLYVPLEHRRRQRLKLFNDLLAQRGSQAIASVLILAIVALEAPLTIVAFVLCTFAAAWLIVAVTTRRAYLDIFRRRLESDSMIDLQYPELDVESLESMLAALNDTDDAKVIAAMELLAREDLVHVIPALILYHPNANVALRAVDLFAQHGRSDFLAVAQRRLADAGPPLRAALIAATATAEMDDEWLSELTKDSDATVRVTAHVFMLRNGWGDAHAHRERIRAELNPSYVPCSIAFVRAVRYSGSTGFESELLDLLKNGEQAVREHVIDELLRRRDPTLLPALRDQLTRRDTRVATQNALLRWGDDARELLLLSLEDRALTSQIRWQLPRALGLFPAHEVVPRMVANVLDEPDGMVRYRSIVELDRLQRRDGPLDIMAELRAVGVDLIRYAFELADWRATLQRFEAETPGVPPTHHLLEQLIADKETNTVDLIVRVIGVAQPGEDIDSIARGLRSADEAVKSSALELLEHLVPAERRDALITLFSGDSPLERLSNAGAIYTTRRFTYPELLRILLEGRSLMLRSLAARLVGELELGELRDCLVATRGPDAPEYDLVAERALGSLPAPEPPRLSLN